MRVFVLETTSTIEQKKYRDSSLALWSQRILDCKNSGLTVSDWCEKNNVHEKSYWRWHKILKDKYQEYCANNSSNTYEAEFYEIDRAPAVESITQKPVATIKIRDISIDVFSGDGDIISSICRGLMSC